MTLERRATMATLLADRGDDLLVVPGLGSTAHGTPPQLPVTMDRNFYLWGAMGGAALIGLGLALAQPDRRVAVITGDGEMLMGLGALATIGIQNPRNLAVIVFDNGVYGETGMQPSHTPERRRPHQRCGSLRHRRRHLSRRKGRGRFGRSCPAPERSQ